MAARAKPKAEPDDGDDGDARLRTCAVSRSQRPVEEMVRFVASPDGTIVPDLGRKLPGRGVWIEARAQTIADAVKGHAFSRSLKRPVQAAVDLPEVVERQLRRRALDALSIANKAGELIAGYGKIDTALAASRTPLLVIHASDAAEDGCRKLDQVSRRIFADSAKLPVRIFTSAELSLALGRSNVIHAALTGGGASLRFTEELARLADFRPRDDGAAQPAGAAE